ncbi:MAG: DUF2637 domain-containing protein [Micromonosporaceae bacterium]
MQLPQLRRIRWAVRIALTLGVAASVAANILHARPNPISQAIAAWPPLALLLTVELTSRIPMHRRLLAACRVFATVAIAGIAAWVSYWHMASVASNYGETDASPYLLPLSVDGLIVVASVSLVELAGRIRFVEEHLARAKGVQIAPPGSLGLSQPLQPTPTPTPRPVFAPAPASVGSPAGNGAPGSHGATSPANAPVSPAVVATPPASAGAARPAGSESGAAPSWVNGSASLPQRPNGGRAVGATSAPVRQTVTSPARSIAATATHTAKVAEPAVATTESADGEDDGSGNAPRQRRPVQETAALADAIEAMHPNISQTELARQLGISATRLRAVRREAREIRRSQRLRTA